jgi:hypothetical protein
MRRALTVFLLLILPLQLSWAVAAGYCQHEEAAKVARHMGHHEHQHSQGAEKAAGHDSDMGAAEKKESSDKPQCVDDDCAYCHLASLKTVGVPATVLVVTAETGFSSHTSPLIGCLVSRRIDRPNWRTA